MNSSHVLYRSISRDINGQLVDLIGPPKHATEMHRGPWWYLTVPAVLLRLKLLYLISLVAPESVPVLGVGRCGTVKAAVT
jgi:hypothetical protein